MFKVGLPHDHRHTVAAETTYTNNPPLKLYRLRNDHKITVDKEKGPTTDETSVWSHPIIQ